MALNVDLRRIKITDIKEAMEFVSIVEAKLPEVSRILKKAESRQQSLQNQLTQAKSQPTRFELAPEQKNVSVTDRLAGKVSEAQRNGERAISQEERLAQLKAASANSTVAPEPGEVGTLAVEEVEPELEVEEHTEQVSEKTPEEIKKELENKTKPSVADTTPVAQKISGKAQSIKDGLKKTGNK